MDRPHTRVLFTARRDRRVCAGELIAHEEPDAVTLTVSWYDGTVICRERIAHDDPAYPAVATLLRNLGAALGLVPLGVNGRRS